MANEQLIHQIKKIANEPDLVTKIQKNDADDWGFIGWLLECESYEQARGIYNHMDTAARDLIVPSAKADEAVKMQVAKIFNVRWLF